MFIYAPPPTDTPLPVIYRDEDCLIVDKPSGLLSVPGRGPGMKDCLIHRLAPVAPRARAVHRLDIETSGLIVIALYRDALIAFSKLFERRNVEKTYLAWVSGCIDGEQGTETGPLAGDWPNRPKQKIDPINGKTARTDWTVLERENERTLVQLKPLTGRTHQLRVHMAAMGHPIQGDRLYGNPKVGDAAARLLLHASRLAFVHPFTGQPIDVTSAAPF